MRGEEGRRNGRRGKRGGEERTEGKERGESIQHTYLPIKPFMVKASVQGGNKDVKRQTRAN